MVGEIEAVKYASGPNKGEQRKDKAGKLVWRLSVSNGSRNGKRVRFRREFHGTHREAERELARLVTAVTDGTLAACPQMPLHKWADIWLKEHAEKHLTARTAASYRLIVEQRIAPGLGHLPLDKLTARHIADFYANLEEEGIRKDGRGDTLSGSTRLKYHRVLSSILQEAVYRHLIPTNPARAVRPPKSQRQEARFYDEADAHRLLLALDREPLRFRVFIPLAITLGLRRGEIIGLEWSHIDFPKKTLTIRQAAQLVSGKGQSLKVPKTAASNRMVSIPDFVLTCLKDWRREQKQQKASAGKAWRADPHGDFIFTDTDGTWYLADQVSKDFRRFADLNNLQTVPLRRLLQALEGEEKRFRAFTLLAFSIASRRETIMKLTWDSIDLVNGLITPPAASDSPAPAAKALTVESSPKEQVSIPDHAAAALLEWQQEQAIERNKAGDRWQGKA
ncbi:MAG: tyrosine-type recombinase/integrase [Armatimonadota bacterium]